MKKTFRLVNLVLFLLLLSRPVSVFAHEGLMWGEKDIRVVKTQWFDIIYAKDSEKSAALLFENADRIYYEIAELYGREPKVRMPVVLSAKTEQFNGYFTSSAYNRIVLYDTAVITELDVFSNTLLSTFRHELTHAYTYNLKSDFWLGVDKIFGDSINSSMITLTSGWAEGATVTSESSQGEGRLNDEYARHSVKQAKIEGKFPSYADVQGASDVYPYGSYYYFNGAFDNWLQKNYGMEKYAQFWYRCINFKSITAGGAFKKVYGIKLKDAWKQFSNDYEVPALTANPLLQEGLPFAPKDFFSGSSSKYSGLNVSGGLYTHLTASKDGIAYLEEKSSSVWYVKNSDIEKGKPKPTRLFTLKGIEAISLSEDGRYMVVSYDNVSTSNILLKEKIYDMEKRHFINVGGSGLKDGIISKLDGDYYLVSNKFKSKDKWIDIKKIQGNSVTDYICVPVEKGNIGFFTPAGNGKFAFVKNSTLDYSVCIFDYSKGDDKSNQLNDYIEEYSDSSYQRLVIRNLAYNPESGKFAFSWTEPGSMPRLGFLNLKTGLFELDKTDISGGIFNPVFTGNKIVYAGNFFRQNRLFYMETPEVESTQGSGKENPEYPNIKEPYVVTSDTPENVLKGAEPYKALNYMNRGLLIPYSSATSRNFNPDAGVEGYSPYGKDVELPFGVSYSTTDPWMGTSFNIAAGYNPYSNSIGTDISLSGGTDTSLFKWQLLTGCEFDLKGYKQSVLEGQTSVVYRFGRNSLAALKNKASVMEGRSNSVAVVKQDKNVLFNSGSTEDNTLLARDNLSLVYSNSHKSGTGVFEYSGVTLSMTGSVYYHKNLETTPKYPVFEEGLNTSLIGNVSVNIPKLIPIQCRDFFVYNLPGTVELTIYPNSSVFMAGNAKFYLFGADFQKAFPFVTCLFANRMYLTADYDCTVIYDTLGSGSGIQIQNTVSHMEKLIQGAYPVSQSVGLDLHMMLGPNIGVFASPNFTTDVSAGIVYEFSPFPGQKPEVNFRFNYTLGM